MSTVQSCVDSYTETVRNITQAIDNKLTNHFHNKNGGDIKIVDLADNIARELDVRQPEVIPLIILYLKSSELLETKNNKTIIQKGVEQPKSLMSPKECGMRHYELVKNLAPQVISKRFEEADILALSQGANNEELSKIKLKFQDLRDDIAAELNIKSYAVYHSLKQYIVSERKDLAIGLGRAGGLYRVKK